VFRVSCFVFIFLVSCFGCVSCSVFRVLGMFWVSGFGFRVSGFKIQVSDMFRVAEIFRVPGFGYVSGFGFRVCFGFRMSGMFRVLSFGFWVSDMSRVSVSGFGHFSGFRFRVSGVSRVSGINRVSGFGYVSSVGVRT